MAIFNSYVKLPEGNQHLKQTMRDIPHFFATRPGTFALGTQVFSLRRKPKPVEASVVLRWENLCIWHQFNLVFIWFIWFLYGFYMI
jgi:hypothetical protein